MAEKRHPVCPRHETQSTEHITVTPELKAGLDFLRGVTKKRSFNDVVLMLFRSYTPTLRTSTFLRTLAELNKREDETINEALDRMLKHKPLKLELDKEIWVGSLDDKDIESCLFGK